MAESLPEKLPRISRKGAGRPLGDAKKQDSNDFASFAALREPFQIVSESN
jgi:hypothetical protein